MKGLGAIVAGLCALGQTALASTIPDAATMKQVVDADPSISLETILGRLPDSLRSNFTLMYQSGSQQSATFEDPRAILYGEDARFIVAFNGSEKQRGGNKLEMISFDDDSATFRFSEVRFEQGRAVYDEHPDCTTCHGEDSRPNWEGYPDWPGGYAGNDDHLDDPRKPQARGKLIDFIARAPSHPRYKNLLGIAEGYQVDPVGRTLRTANIDFDERVATLNFKRLVRILRATPKYDVYKYLVIQRLLCLHLFEGLPDLEPFGVTTGNIVTLDTPSKTPPFYWVFEGRGIDTYRWDMSFRPDSHPLSTNIGTPGNGFFELAGALAEQDADLRALIPFVYETKHGVTYPYVNLVYGENLGPVCEAINSASRAALEPVSEELARTIKAYLR